MSSGKGTPTESDTPRTSPRGGTNATTKAVASQWSSERTAALIREHTAAKQQVVTVGDATNSRFTATKGLIAQRDEGLRDVRVKNGSAKGIKMEVGAGDFGTDRKPKDFYGTHGGDVLTELVKGTRDSQWGRDQSQNATTLWERGAHVYTGVSATNLPGAMTALFGDNMPALRKLKIENPAATSEQKKMGDKKGLKYGDVFASADQALAKGGVVEWGLTGHAGDHQKVLAPVVKQAKEKGFELVEVRTKQAKSHTFSQEARGIGDKADLSLTQYVFARSTEADSVRAYTLERMKTKGSVTSGAVRYGNKTRTLVPKR